MKFTGRLVLTCRSELIKDYKVHSSPQFWRGIWRNGSYDGLIWSMAVSLIKTTGTVVVVHFNLGGEFHPVKAADVHDLFGQFL